MNVLIACEDKTTGQILVDYVAAQSWDAGTKFTLVHAVEPLDIDDFVTAVYGQTEQKGILEKRVAKAREFLDELVVKLSPALSNCQVKSEVMIGRAREVIVYLAQTYGVDQIVIGSHGRGAIGRFFLGSVSLAVVNGANCTTTIIRTTKQSAEDTAPVPAVAFDYPNGERSSAQQR